MPASRRLALVAALLLTALLPSAVFAALVADLASAATTTHGLGCTDTGARIVCTESPVIGVTRYMEVAPASGELVTLRLEGRLSIPAEVVGLGSGGRALFQDMLGIECGAGTGDAFVDELAVLFSAATLPPRDVGTCVVSGGLDTTSDAVWVYYADAAPGTLATPTPTARPTRSPSPAPSPSPSSSPSPTPSPSPSPSSPPTPPPSLAASAAPSVAPAPSASIPPAAGPRSFADSVPALADVRLDPGAAAGAIGVALLVLLLVGFAGELFNDTLESNADRVAALLRRGPLGLLGRLGRALEARPWIGVPAFLLAAAVVSALVDPSLAFDGRSAAVVLGFLVGLAVVLAAFKLPGMLAHRRATGELGRLRPLPWALVVGAVFVVVSRIGELQPGYLFGLVLGASFTRETSDAEEGRETAIGSFLTLVVSVAAWLALTAVRGAGGADDDLARIVAETALAVVVVSGLEALAFGLVPMSFLPGSSVRQWRRSAWALLWTAGVGAFVLILIGPTSGYVIELSPEGFAAALGPFAGFAALSFGVWWWFRRPRPPAPGPDEEPAA